VAAPDGEAVHRIRGVMAKPCIASAVWWRSRASHPRCGGEAVRHLPSLTPMPLFRRKLKSDPPILAVDVDGVISLFGFDQAIEPGRANPEKAPGEFHLIDGMLHCIALDTGPRLNRLANSFELIWASGWEDRANDHLPGILGLPELPYLTFDGRARFGTAHWKLEALEEYADDRPLAWIDDSLDESCYEWAEQREAPTLLVPTESDQGLLDVHVEALESWVRDGFHPR
jgi:hypothetical protein